MELKAAPTARQEAVIAGQLDDLARRVERLVISHRKPEAFWEEKSEIAYELRRVADEVGFR